MTETFRIVDKRCTTHAISCPETELEPGFYKGQVRGHSDILFWVIGGRIIFLPAAGPIPTHSYNICDDQVSARRVNVEIHII